MTHSFNYFSLGLLVDYRRGVDLTVPRLGIDKECSVKKNKLTINNMTARCVKPMHVLNLGKSVNNIKK